MGLGIRWPRKGSQARVPYWKWDVFDQVPRKVPEMNASDIARFRGRQARSVGHGRKEEANKREMSDTAPRNPKAKYRTGAGLSWAKAARRTLPPCKSLVQLCPSSRRVRVNSLALQLYTYQPSVPGGVLQRMAAGAHSQKQKQLMPRQQCTAMGKERWSGFCWSSDAIGNKNRVIGSLTVERGNSSCFPSLSDEKAWQKAPASQVENGKTCVWKTDHPHRKSRRVEGLGFLKEEAESTFSELTNKQHAHEPTLKHKQWRCPINLKKAYKLEIKANKIKKRTRGKSKRCLQKESTIIAILRKSSEIILPMK